MFYDWFQKYTLEENWKNYLSMLLGGHKLAGRRGIVLNVRLKMIQM